MCSTARCSWAVSPFTEIGQELPGRHRGDGSFVQPSLVRSGHLPVAETSFRVQVSEVQLVFVGLERTGHAPRVATLECVGLHSSRQGVGGQELQKPGE